MPLYGPNSLYTLMFFEVISCNRILYISVSAVYIFFGENSMYTLVIIKLQKATVVVKFSEIDGF